MGVLGPYINRKGWPLLGILTRVRPTKRDCVNYYEHHLGDWAQATAHLSFLEDAAYSRLIRKYYADEKPLPADLQTLFRLVGAREKKEREAVSSVLSEFFVLGADGWHNTRCDRELSRYKSKRIKAQESANARWHPLQTQSESNANAMRTHSEGNAHQSPVTSNQTPIKENKQKKPAVAAPEGVSSELWDAFIGMRKAKKAPITALVLKGLQEEASKAGWTMEAVLQEIVTRGWTSFKADWVAQKQTSKESFYERETRAREEQFKRLTGRFDYDNPFTIDMETDNASE